MAGPQGQPRRARRTRHPWDPVKAADNFSDGPPATTTPRCQSLGRGREAGGDKGTTKKSPTPVHALPPEGAGTAGAKRRAPTTTPPRRTAAARPERLENQPPPPGTERRVSVCHGKGTNGHERHAKGPATSPGAPRSLPLTPACASGGRERASVPTATVMVFSLPHNWPLRGWHRRSGGARSS